MGSTNKGNWYKLLIEKMDQSIADGHYFEAIFIEYMIIDDRVKSLAKIAGVDLLLSKDGSTDKYPKMLGQLLDDIKDAKANMTKAPWRLLDYGIPLAPKETLKVIKKEKYPIKMVKECVCSPRQLINFNKSKSGKYNSAYGDTNSSLIVQIKKWVNLRNHWMHAAGDDNLTKDEYESIITPLAIDGNSFARELCDITIRIKRAKK